MEMKLGMHAYYIISMMTAFFSIINFHRGHVPFHRDINIGYTACQWKYAI